MKKILLTQGKTALIDDEDYGLVIQYNWRADKKGNNWYAVRSIKLETNKWVKQGMHNLIAGTKLTVHHKNGDGLDNTRTNLRWGTVPMNGE